jgi:uncharacterized protein
MRSGQPYLLFSPENPSVALVTGASSGIGRSIALEMVPYLSRIILASRNESDLNQLAEAIRKIKPIQVDVAPTDLSQSEGSFRLIQFLKDRQINIDLLVLSAGRSKFGEFHSGSISEDEELLELMNGSTVKLVKSLLPGMIERGAGGILFVSSLYAVIPAPYQAIYAASKSFMTSLAEGIRGETQKQGIVITSVLPGVTATRFRASAGETEPKGMDPDLVAKLAVRGWAKGKSTVVPGWKNLALYLIVQMIPRRWRPTWTTIFNRFRGMNKKSIPNHAK